MHKRQESDEKAVWGSGLVRHAWFHSLKVLMYLATLFYCFYSSTCSSSCISWFAASTCLALHAIAWHASTQLQCRSISFFFALLMLQSPDVESIVICVLIVLQPWFPPRCDRCDGNHLAAQCPHFPLARPIDIEDSWTHYNNAPAPSPDDGNNICLRGAKVLRQPGDGHCLFHSLGTGLQKFGYSIGGETLRRDIMHLLITHATDAYGTVDETS